MTLSLADLVRRSQRLLPRTKRQYVQSIGKFIEFAGDDPASWTPLAVEAWRDAMRESGMKPQSVNAHFYAVRYASKRWAALGLGDNFAVAAEALRIEPQREKRGFRPDEVAAILEATSGDDPPSLRDRALFVVGIQAGGRRVSELASLTWEGIDAGARRAMFIIKGDRDHWVNLDEECVMSIEHWAAALHQLTGKTLRGQVFRSLRRGIDDQWIVGDTMSDVSIAEAIRERGRQAGVRKIHPHLLRHTFVYQCLNAGVPVHVVMQMTGHKSLQSLSWYIEKMRAAGAAGDLPRLTLPETRKR